MASASHPARRNSGSRAEARARLGQRSLATVRGGDREGKQQVTGLKTSQGRKGSHTRTQTPLRGAGGSWSRQVPQPEQAGWRSGRQPPNMYCLVGTGFKFGKMKEVLETDGGDGCTTT